MIETVNCVPQTTCGCSLFFAATNILHYNCADFARDEVLRAGAVDMRVGVGGQGGKQGLD
jgi:hypothetical protein